MCCAADNHNYICQTCAKEFLDSNSTVKKLLTKYHIFTKLPRISHILTKIVIFQVYLHSLDQLLLPYKFYGRDLSGISFPFLPVVSR